MSLTFNMVSGNYGDMPTPTEKTVSGAVVHITDALREPAVALLTAINPVQDLHGYAKPWPPGGGKNKFVIASATWGALSGVTYVYDASTNTLSKSGTSSGASGYNVATLTLPQGTYTISAKFEETGSGTGILLRKTDSSTNAAYIGADSPSATVSLNGEYYLRLSTEAGATGGTISEIQIELSATKTAYEPPQNICPISGFSAANIVVSPTLDAQDGTVYPISWQTEAGTVYGGTLDVLMGVLTVDRAIQDIGDRWWTYDSNANRFSVTFNDALAVAGWNQIDIRCSCYQIGQVASDSGPDMAVGIWNKTVYIRDSNYTTTADLRTARAGQKIVYQLATPLIYDLTPTEITLLLGTNNVWSDTNGDTTLTYKADGRVNSLTALNILLGNMYTPSADVSDREALDIIMGESE